MSINGVQQAWIDVYQSYKHGLDNAQTEAERQFWEARLKQIQPTLDALDIDTPGGSGSHCSCEDYYLGDDDYYTTPEIPPPVRLSSTEFGARDGPANGKYDAMINEAAEKYGVDPNVLKCLMAKESQGNPYAVSSAGAVGLMQIKPETASEMAGRPVSAEELKNNPELNIELGTKYFAKMLREKGNLEDALGAYNQGPNANWRSIPESIDYVNSIMTALRNGTLPHW